jgi:large subunit ribosomal protein L24
MAKRIAHQHRIRRGDQVVVVTGAAKGTRGRVLRVLRDSDRIVVEGVNLVHRHVRRSQKNPQGGRVRREAPIHISNVMLVDPAADVPTKIGRMPAGKDSGPERWARMARKTGELVGESSAKPAKKGKKGKE